MSITIMAQVWKAALPDSEKLVLLALADCANDEGACWPSMKTLTEKCSKSDRTIQAAIKVLVAKGHLSRIERPGKGCLYHVHPATPEITSGRSTPEAASPRSDFPPKGTTLTPEAASDKPSRTTNIKHTEKRACGKKHLLPDDWKPLPFGPDTESAAVVAGWPPGVLKAQVEHFTAHHSAKGNRFVDWQKAWSTWVLNNRNFRNGSNVRASGHQGPDRRNGLAKAIDRELAGTASPAFPEMPSALECHAAEKGW